MRSISHNKEFTNAVTSEKWIMEKGRLRREGESIEKKSEQEDDFIEDKNKVVFDSFGNEMKIEKKVELSDKEKKRKIKQIQKQIKDGKKKRILNRSKPV